jgi:hypothetical protein
MITSHLSAGINPTQEKRRVYQTDVRQAMGSVRQILV